MSGKNKIEQCNYGKAWVGGCKTEVSSSGDRCKEHADIKCASCGSDATRECDETGQFVCGAPLCDNCEHTISKDGTNGGVGFNAQDPPKGMKAHCKKTEQQHSPWYVTDQ